MKGKINLPTKIIKFKLKFEVEKQFGTPGAFVIENEDKHEFFLKSATLQYIVPERKHESFHFKCNSWVYPLDKTGVKRIFFLNQLYLPSKTPPGLVELRKKEVEKLRGKRLKDEIKPWDRVYDYDYYNDLGDPDNGREYARPVLGGHQFPYPRRLKTGRPACQHDESAECRPAGCFQVYVPPDERLSHEKQEEVINNLADALIHFITGKPRSESHRDTSKFDSPEEIFDFFSDKEVRELEGWVMQKLQKLVPTDILNQVVATTETSRNLVNSQLPSIIAEDKYAWLYDGEFGRQMLAGTNPVRIRLLKDYSEIERTNWPNDDTGKTIQEVRKGRIQEGRSKILNVSSGCAGVDR
ncbi:Lipoxygenase [Corchorus capsularis]|uniref:Lipoxygenase n=1 Tax=Corchorus capsularis TaxID=210143 RepID=A0A1R3IW65_COCAP|nr:Lipoxygenase [Corchorus capsularis]